MIGTCLELTNQSYKIENLERINADSQLEITFTESHGLSAGTPTSQADYFGITNAKTEGLKRCVSSSLCHRS